MDALPEREQPLAGPAETTTALVVVMPLAQAGQAADTAAAANVFVRYRQRLGKATRDRHAADLACFTDYLYLAGIEAGELLLDPLAWAGMSWGLVAGFIEWQLQQGYAIGSAHVRLSTVKLYCQLALQAEVLTTAPMPGSKWSRAFAIKPASRSTRSAPSCAAR